MSHNSRSLKTFYYSKCYRIINLYDYGSVYKIKAYMKPKNEFMPHLFIYRYMFKNSAKVGLQEAGPRFTLKLRSLQHGTFDSTTGEYIWVHNVSVCTVHYILV